VTNGAVHRPGASSNWTLALILLVYLVSQVSLLHKPGLQNDEAVFLVPSLELAQGKAISYGYSVTIFGTSYPTMLGDYTGNSLTLPVAATVRLFGFSLPLVRFLWVLAGAVTILFTFLVGRELFDARVGVAAALLLAVDPTFWMFTHVGAHASVTMTADVMISLFAWLVFLRGRRLRWCFVAAFFVGHGLYTKLAFVYFGLAYVIAFVWMWCRGRLGRDIVTARALGVAVAGLLLGGWPLVYNLRPGTLNALKRSLTGPQLRGEGNLDIGHNLVVRLNQTWSYLLEGRMPIDSIVAGVPVAHNVVMPYVFTGMLVFLGAAILWPRDRVFPKARIALVLLVFGLFQALSIFTPSSLNYGVYAFIPPFTALIVALGFCLMASLLSSLGPYRLGRVAVGGLALVALASTWTLADHWRVVSRTGGRGHWSSTVFQLSDFLMRHPERTPVALDWGLDQPVYVLSNLRVKPTTSYMPFTRDHGVLRLWNTGPPPEFREAMESLVYRPRHLYLVRNERRAGFKGRLAVLNEVVSEGGGELVQTHSITEPDGEEVIRVFEVRWRDGTPPRPTVDALPPDSPLRRQYPELTALHPPRALVGERFNRQPNGRAAIAVAGKRFTSDSVIYFGDDPLDTVYGGEGLLTAFVPDEFIARPGELHVSVKRGRFTSNTVILTIAPTP
jgi:hypothetical protein